MSHQSEERTCCFFFFFNGIGWPISSLSWALYLSLEPGWGSRRRGSWWTRGCASWGWTRRWSYHGWGCPCRWCGAWGWCGTGPPWRRLRAGNGVRHQRLLFNNWRSGRSRGRAMCTRRGPVVWGGLSIFDALKANTAALHDKRRDGGLKNNNNNCYTLSFKSRMQIKIQCISVHWH